jgi:hypothetical protein
MWKRIWSILNNNWVVFIIGAIISAVGIKIFYSAIIDFFIQKFTVPLWFIILLPILTFCLLLCIIWIKTKFGKNRKPKLPKYTAYTEDIIGSQGYHWEYFLDADGKYRPFKIIQICNFCRCEVVSFRCPECKKQYSPSDYQKQASLQAVVKHRIEHKYSVRI